MFQEKAFNINIVSDVDLSKFAGDTCRTLAFAIELVNNGFHVNLIVPTPTKNEIMINHPVINLIYVPVKQVGRSMLNIIKRRYALIKAAKQLRDDSSMFLVETSVVGGYFALFGGFSEFILDVHGIAFDEVNFATLPWYVPKFIYRKFIYFLEKIAVKKASRILVVSESMANYLDTSWNVPRSKISIIPNGYFDAMVSNVIQNGIEEINGMVSFVGHLAKWANVDKIIRAAALLKNENATVFIIGDGPSFYINELRGLAKQYGATNITFTGKIPLEEAYKRIASSQVVLLPFPKTLCTEVACPIKVLEYMAFGRAMVLDEVSDLTKYLKEKNAALVSNPHNEIEFVENIRRLLKDSELRKTIGCNAAKLTKDFTWEKQGMKLRKQILSLITNLAG